MEKIIVFEIVGRIFILLIFFIKNNYDLNHPSRYIICPVAASFFAKKINQWAISSGVIRLLIRHFFANASIVSGDSFARCSVSTGHGAIAFTLISGAHALASMFVIWVIHALLTQYARAFSFHQILPSWIELVERMTHFLFSCLKCCIASCEQYIGHRRFVDTTISTSSKSTFSKSSTGHIPQALLIRISSVPYLSKILSNIVLIWLRLVISACTIIPSPHNSSICLSVSSAAAEFWL